MEVMRRKPRRLPIPKSGFKSCKRWNAVRAAFAESRVTMSASWLRSSARIAGSTRLVVMSPIPITSQVSTCIF